MKKILINKNPWQTRVAVLNGERLQDVYFDTANQDDLERCFFKGVVAKVLPGMQTAFVDFGQPKAGFLHISEIDRVFAAEKALDLSLDDDEREALSAKFVKTSVQISKILTEGQHILVQVTKEPISEKGAKLTTCFTLPGRFIVLMPNIAHIGVSKKIEEREKRFQLRELVRAHLPKGMGAIVRTPAADCSEAELKRDIAFLVSTWSMIQKKYRKADVCQKIYDDLPMSLRAIRDHLDDDVEMVIVDEPTELKAVSRFTRYITPQHVGKLRQYDSKEPLFDRFKVEEQIESALCKKVTLPSGGSIVIESTEAMTVVDVNTGRFTGSDSHEDTISRTNMEAAFEIVIQLRLRNIGGLIVIDFIDMAHASNRTKLSRFLEKTLKEKDKFQSVTLKISEFGLVQMTRKRSGKTLQAQLTQNCYCCGGNGTLKAIPTLAFQVLRLTKDEVIRRGLTGQITVTVSPAIAQYLTRTQYHALLEYEKQADAKLLFETNAQYADGQYSVARSKKNI